ncbi:hypothetical protein [Microvirga brassicacearum]|uniref:Uncharacterized protein n=1 Tax=Microvirga brassicacearum TaxID=2580413 RepID=A0A5N3PBA7_9HYPH|nr:hypothetical protein [Microvirga brassicacearum]KAB0266983.1 hypothetical protein FEZ63_11140 [Microvirga brassicacearum]
MTRSRQETYDWYENATAAKAPRARAEALPATTDSRLQFGWWIAGVAFSSLWMLESWTHSFPSPNRVGGLAGSLWALLLSLSICYGIYKFSKVQSKAIATLLCVISAIVLLLHHATRV